MIYSVFELSAILPSSINSLTHQRLVYTCCTCSAVLLGLSARGVVSDAGGGAAAGASTSGTFSFTGDTGAVTAVLAVAGGSSTDEGVVGAALPKARAISSNVFPFVSGTLMNVKMKKTMRRAAKMRKTQGPSSS